MKTRTETAVEKFLEGYNCAQSVYYCFCDDLRIDRDIALKSACGFGGGMGRKGEVCGAVAGGIMVIGSKYGRGLRDGREAGEGTYAKTRELMDRFSEKHQSYICRTLLDGCELATEKGHNYFKEQDLLNKTCVPCVKSVVEILEEII